MNLSDIYNIFFELLQIAVGNSTSLSRAPSADEWEQIYELSKQHTLTGIVFAAVECLPQEQLPPPRRIRQWAVKADRLRENNLKISRQTADVAYYFRQKGFNCMILKGQGNMYYYPDRLKGLRTPGDIDVWAFGREEPKGNSEKCHADDNIHKGDVRAVIEFCQSIRKGEYIYYHNLDFPILKDTAVEVHYRPSWLYCPWHNSKVQRWFKEYKRNGTFIPYDGYTIPTTEFNVVFQLLHLYKHIFEEGIGLRQLLDYYMLLMSEERIPDSEYALIKSFGLQNFAGAVMYVLQRVFCNSDEQQDWMLCPPNGHRGDELLAEIMQSGNFGQHDSRYNWAEVTNGSMHYRGLPYAMARLRHNMHFLWSYPSEVLFEPLFRLYNKLWLKLRLWRFE